MSNPQNRILTKPMEKPTTQPFPPRRDFASLSVHDLLDAREAYHVYLSSLENVVATAIGRYRIHKDDWYATHSPDKRRPEEYPRVSEPRTLSNSVVKAWSWPAVVVFVREWETPDKLGDQVVPRSLYLPDGRVVPTCVIQATPDTALPPPVPGPTQASSLLGGSYSALREHQGVNHVGTFGCLVYKEGTYYALTNRHVAGSGEEVIRAFVHGEYHRVGVSANIGLTRILMPEIFPSWPGDKTYLTLDAGLVRIDNFEDWTSQVFGIGEIGATFDATEQTITLDLIGCPVRAFGGTTGVIEGEIQALFFRYESLGGYDYTTDVLVGPRTFNPKETAYAPFTRPGDSGTLWFYDPPSGSRVKADGDEDEDEDVDPHLPPERGRRARRLRPIAMQWGGQRFVDADGSTSAFALGSFASSVCRALDVEMVRDWSTGHDEYWGKLGHFAIGWKACEHLSGKLSTLMKANQVRIGFGDEKLGLGSEFRMGNNDYVPLADVPDYVWIGAPARSSEGIQHFADVDIYGIGGGNTLLRQCHDDQSKISATVWKEFFDGFAEAGVGPDEGALPFRVWQIWDAMVGYLVQKDVIRFVAAAGILAHYIGDASQPLHCSYMHHGVPPMLKRNGRKYPVRKESAEFTAFKKTRPSKIHGIYEETMLEVDTPTVLASVDAAMSQASAMHGAVERGHDAAVETVRLMYNAQERLSPETIINADDPSLTVNERASRLWNNQKVRRGTIRSLADSVRLLAGLWTAAWEAGKGDSIAKSKLVQFGEPELAKIYRKETTFIPSLSLAKMAQSQKFEP
jgi:hypothetical protein